MRYLREIIDANEDREVVLISWPVGSTSRPHDHGISYGRVWVLRGRIFQKVYDKASKFFIKHELICEGQNFIETPDTIHIMGNAWSKESITLHVYSPPLQMTDYKKSLLKNK